MSTVELRLGEKRQRGKNSEGAGSFASTKALSHVGREGPLCLGYYVEDRLARLSWEQMQDLVAGILRPMGYRTTVSEAGPDRGFDIFASPERLGLQEPRIFVEVKHRTASMGSPQIRSFLGARQPGDRWLYVSTGGFTREARYEAERSSVPLRLITMKELRWLLLEHYDRLDGETRALIPLRRLYWPADP